MSSASVERDIVDNQVDFMVNNSIYTTAIRLLLLVYVMYDNVRSTSSHVFFSFISY